MMKMTRRGVSCYSSTVLALLVCLFQIGDACDHPGVRLGYARVTPSPNAITFKEFRMDGEDIRYYDGDKALGVIKQPAFRSVTTEGHDPQVLLIIMSGESIKVPIYELTFRNVAERAAFVRAYQTARDMHNSKFPIVLGIAKKEPEKKDVWGFAVPTGFAKRRVFVLDNDFSVSYYEVDESETENGKCGKYVNYIPSNYVFDEAASKFIPLHGGGREFELSDFDNPSQFILAYKEGMKVLYDRRHKLLSKKINELFNQHNRDAQARRSDFEARQRARSCRMHYKPSKKLEVAKGIVDKLVLCDLLSRYTDFTELARRYATAERQNWVDLETGKWDFNNLGQRPI